MCAHSSLQNSTHILDVGCGTGKLTYELGRAYPSSNFLGIDPSVESVRIARGEGDSLPNVEFKALFVEEYAKSHSERNFDVVFANMLFQNVSSLDEALLACARVMRSRGSLIFALPHPCFWPRYWRYDKESWFDYGEEIWIEAPFKTSLLLDGNLRTTHAHRPLAMYFEAFFAAGFVLDQLREPVPDSGLEGVYPIAWDFPRFLVGSCILGEGGP